MAVSRGIVTYRQDRRRENTVLRRRISGGGKIVLYAQRGIAEWSSRRRNRELRTEWREVDEPVVDYTRSLRVVEHTEAAADAHPRILTRSIGDSYPGREIGHLAGGSARMHAGIAREQQARRRVREHLRPDTSLEI